MSRVEHRGRLHVVVSPDGDVVSTHASPAEAREACAALNRQAAEAPAVRERPRKVGSTAYRKGYGHRKRKDPTPPIVVRDATAAAYRAAMLRLFGDDEIALKRAETAAEHVKRFLPAAAKKRADARDKLTRGLALEDQGKNQQEIAAELGYKSTRGWRKLRNGK